MNQKYSRAPLMILAMCLSLAGTRAGEDADSDKKAVTAAFRSYWEALKSKDYERAVGLMHPLSVSKAIEKLLDPTEPELDGRVDRDGLLDFCGRTRKPQMALAAALGITDYPQPAGGCCFLADLNYARKFFDLVAHRPQEQRITHEDVILLSIGRHFRLPGGEKVIVGRNEHENRVLENYGRGKHWVMDPADLVGPMVLVEGTAEYPALALAARIGGRYVDRPNGEDLVRFECTRGEIVQAIQAPPMAPAGIDAYRIQS